MLHEFLVHHQAAVVARARARVATRRVPIASEEELAEGVPAFLAQLTHLLGETEQSPPPGFLSTTSPQALGVMGESADRQGDALLRAGLTVAQVIEGYGDVCQAITEEAVEAHAAIAADEFHTLNLCLDVATARAVTAFSSARDRRTAAAETERLGALAHEMRNLLSTALLAYHALQRGGAGIQSNTGAALGRSLRGLRDLIDRALAEVRISAALRSPERVELAPFIEEMEVGAALDAKAKGLALSVPTVEQGLTVTADRPLLASAVGNLVQNAIKFTPAGGRVSLSSHRDSQHVVIDVEDECGGLPAGQAEAMFRPFERRGKDASGLGLGLKISQDAVRANGGEIQVRNVPGRGCVFSILLPATP